MAVHEMDNPQCGEPHAKKFQNVTFVPPMTSARRAAQRGARLEPTNGPRNARCGRVLGNWGFEQQRECGPSIR